MAPFTRIFPFLQRFQFPPHGKPLNPREVGEQIVLVHEMFRGDVKHGLRFETNDGSQAGAGADITITICVEPPKGICSIPLVIAANRTGVAGAQQVRLSTFLSGNARDIPNIYPTLDWLDFTMTATVPGFWVDLPFRLPLTAGNEMRMTFVAAAVGSTVLFRSVSLWTPIDTVDFSRYGVDSITRSQAL